MTIRDPEFDALSEKEIFEEARARLKIATDAESDNRNDAKYAMRFREGEQWGDEPVSTTSVMDGIELTINLTDAFVTRVENNIREQRPRGKCHPVGDGADVETAQIINGIGRHVETRSDASIAYDMACKCAITGGWGYFRIISEYLSEDGFEKDLRILPIRNPFTVYMDPSSIMPDGHDQGWCLISVKMKLAEYRRKYGKEPAVDWNDVGRDEQTLDWQDGENIRLAEYFRIREIEEKLYLLKDAQGNQHTRFKSEMPAKESLEAAGLVIAGERQSTRRKVEWFRLNGLKVIQREQLPGKWIPVFRVQGNAVEIDGEVKRRGMVKAMIDPQRMVNYGEVSKIKRLGLTPKAPWVAAEGQLDGHPEWDNANTQSYSVLTYKPVVIETSNGSVPLPPPQRQQPAGIEQGFSEFVQSMRTNLTAIAGMPNEPGVDRQGEVISGRALRQRAKISDQSHYQYYDNLTLAIAQCWRVMLDWIPAYYSEPGRIQRIIGEDSTPEIVNLNEKDESEGIKKVKNDLSVGRYDVVMDVGPGYETRREEGAEALLQLVNSSALGQKISQVGADLVVRSIDAPYMQELADRFSAMTPEGLQKVMEGMPERARSIITAISAENDQLKQALQKAEMEAKYRITAAHLQATTKAHDTELRSQTTIEKTHLETHRALAVEEIKAGASLLNTHAEAKHHKEAAERMIQESQKAESTDNGVAK